MPIVNFLQKKTTADQTNNVCILRTYVFSRQNESSLPTLKAGDRHQLTNIRRYLLMVNFQENIVYLEMFIPGNFIVFSRFSSFSFLTL